MIKSRMHETFLYGSTFEDFTIGFPSYDKYMIDE